jgi:hypothetical protein
VKYRDHIDESLFPPQVNWRNVRNDRKRNLRRVATFS